MKQLIINSKINKVLYMLLLFAFIILAFSRIYIGNNSLNYSSQSFKPHSHHKSEFVSLNNCKCQFTCMSANLFYDLYYEIIEDEENEDDEEVFDVQQKINITVLTDYGFYIESLYVQLLQLCEKIYLTLTKSISIIVCCFRI